MCVAVLFNFILSDALIHESKLVTNDLYLAVKVLNARWLHGHKKLFDFREGKIELMFLLRICNGI